MRVRVRVMKYTAWLTHLSYPKWASAFGENLTNNAQHWKREPLLVFLLLEITTHIQQWLNLRSKELSNSYQMPELGFCLCRPAATGSFLVTSTSIIYRINKTSFVAKKERPSTLPSLLVCEDEIGRRRKINKRDSEREWTWSGLRHCSFCFRSMCSFACSLSVISFDLTSYDCSGQLLGQNNSKWTFTGRDISVKEWPYSIRALI